MDELAIPILTEGDANNSRIINMSVEKINQFLKSGGIAIIPGFKGSQKIMTSLPLEEEVLMQQLWR